MFTIELTSGASWDQPSEIIVSRDCATNSIEAAAAEALHWLVEIQEAGGNTRNSAKPRGHTLPGHRTGRGGYWRPIARGRSTVVGSSRRRGRFDRDALLLAGRMLAGKPGYGSLSATGTNISSCAWTVTSTVPRLPSRELKVTVFTAVTLA